MHFKCICDLAGLSTLNILPVLRFFNISEISVWVRNTQPGLILPLAKTLEQWSVTLFEHCAID